MSSKRAKALLQMCSGGPPKGATIKPKELKENTVKTAVAAKRVRQSARNTSEILDPPSPVSSFWDEVTEAGDIKRRVVHQQGAPPALPIPLANNSEQGKNYLISLTLKGNTTGTERNFQLNESSPQHAPIKQNVDSAKIVRRQLFTPVKALNDETLQEKSVPELTQSPIRERNIQDSNNGVVKNSGLSLLSHAPDNENIDPTNGIEPIIDSMEIVQENAENAYTKTYEISSDGKIVEVTTDISVEEQVKTLLQLNENSEQEIEDEPSIDAVAVPEQLPLLANLEPANNGEPSSEEQRVQKQGKRQNHFPRANARKRVSVPSRWICNERKKAKNTGKGYISPDGRTLIKPAKMRNPCSCHMKCFQKFSEDRRREIFNEFYEIGDHQRQWEYIIHHSKSSPVKRKTVEGSTKRGCSREYFFTSAGGEEIKVCKYIFMSTLGIWDSWIQSAYQHFSCGSPDNGGVKRKVVSPDKRGRHPNRPKKTKEEQKQSICAHINQYPRIPSHYTRSRSRREYLETGLSIEKMAKHYKEWCVTNQVPPGNVGSCRQYREVLNRQFNIGFFKPKKDQCSICSIIKKSTRPEREKLKPTWVKHLSNKTEARAVMKDTKKKATDNREIYCVAFDLQKVMPCPKSDVSEFYYASKLNVFNLTCFNFVSHDADCFMWHEMIAKRGANEIGSCMLKAIEKYASAGMKEMKSFSDCCSGQNRNRFFFSMLMFAAVKFNIKITHTFLEPGHSQNENDSIHANIERASKHLDIYDFQGWLDVVKVTCQGTPYSVHEMLQEDFYDFKILAKMQNWETDTNSNKIYINKIKVIEFDGSQPSDVRIKYDYKGDPILLKLNARRGRPVSLDTYTLSKAYNGKLPLTNNKIKCLTMLCKKLLIPSTKQEFWNRILSNANPVLMDEDPDADEEDCQEEDELHAETIAEVNTANDADEDSGDEND